MYPSWMFHRVAPHHGDGDRITIGMNLHSPWLERSRFWTHRRGFLWRNFPWLMRPMAKLRGTWDQSPSGAPPGYAVEPDTTYLGGTGPEDPAFRSGSPTAIRACPFLGKAHTTAT